jgi:hypothetical protein
MFESMTNLLKVMKFRAEFWCAKSRGVKFFFFRVCTVEVLLAYDKDQTNVRVRHFILFYKCRPFALAVDLSQACLGIENAFRSRRKNA